MPRRRRGGMGWETWKWGICLTQVIALASAWWGGPPAGRPARGPAAGEGARPTLLLGWGALATRKRAADEHRRLTRAAPIRTPTGFDRAIGQQRHRASASRTQQAGFHVEQQLVARVGDVEVAHGELADPILRRKCRFALLHGQPLGLISEVRAGGVENRVVVPAAEFHGHFTGDGARNPPLGGFPKHHRLRIEPAALIEQAAEPESVDAVLLDGVFVVDAGHQALVADEEERQAGSFVNAAALGFDDAVFNLIARAQPVAAADGIGLEDEL